MDSGNRSHTRKLAWVIAPFIFFLGCESMPGWKRNPLNSEHVEAEAKASEMHRRQYQSAKDAAALRWLLANELRNGMTIEEVNHALGEEGIREVNDRDLKAKGGLYRVDDEMYKYGPDNKGQSYYLAFRDGVLFHFDHKEFDDGPPRKVNALEAFLNRPE